MSSRTEIVVPYGQFTHALTEVLAENAVGPARRGRLARARAAVKNHPDYAATLARTADSGKSDKVKP